MCRNLKIIYVKQFDLRILAMQKINLCDFLPIKS